MKEKFSIIHIESKSTTNHFASFENLPRGGAVNWGESKISRRLRKCCLKSDVVPRPEMELKFGSQLVEEKSQRGR